MTKNQIAYQQLQEVKRSNLAQEALTTRRDEASIEARQLELSETRRHNRATEGEAFTHNRISEAEVTRHNMAVEAQSMVSLGIQQQQADTAQHQADTARMNAYTNRGQLGVAQFQAQETQRANQAREAETYRHNFENEKVSQQEAATKQQQADTQSGYVAAQIPLLNAQADKTSTETSYLGQKNVRDWLDTGSTVLSSIARFRNPNQSKMPTFSSLLSGIG